MFTVRVLAPNATTARDHKIGTKREALEFIRRGAGLTGNIKVGRIARFPRLYVVQYVPVR